MLKSALGLFAAIFAIFGMTSSADAETFVSAAKAPGIVTPAGNHVVFYDRTRLLVLNPYSRGEPRWLTVQPPLGAQYDGRLTCSADGKGTCAVGLSLGGRKLLALVNAAAAKLLVTRIEFDQVLAVVSDEQIYVSRSKPDGKQHIWRVNAATGQSILLDTVKQGEKFALLPINGALEPVFIVKPDTIRLPGQLTPLLVSGGVSAGRSTNTRSQFGANDLFQKYPDGLDRAVIWKRSYLRDQGQVRGGPFDRVDFQLPAPALMHTESFTTDQQGHVIGLETSANGLNLVALCTSRAGQGGEVRGPKPLIAFPKLTEVRITGNGLGNGFVVRIRRPGEREFFNYVRFKHSAPDRLGGSACADLDAAIIENLPIPGSALPAGWIEEVRELVIPGGTTVSGIFQKPSEGPISTLIVDVYGASALLRTTLAAPNDFLQSSAMKGVAIFYPVLPGDGNLGWDFATSARSPNRRQTVRTLTEVLRQTRGQLLTKDAKLILRGGSAGGWLAIKTALSQPELVDEVVAISGAYFFEQSDDGVRLADFFSPSDSVTDREVAVCGQTFFRLIHGTGDQVTPLDRTKRFAGMMSANKCKGALHIVVGGDHNLTDFWDFQTNPEIRNILHWEHGLEP